MDSNLYTSTNHSSRPIRGADSPEFRALFVNNWQLPFRQSWGFLNQQEQEIIEFKRNNPPMIYIRKLYKYVYNSNGRFAQWMDRAIQNALRYDLGRDVDCESIQEAKTVSKIHAHVALILLTYGPNALFNQKLIKLIATHTELAIPELQKTRAESRFALKLGQMVENIDSGIVDREVVSERQVRIGSCIVDFVITLREPGTEKTLEQYVIEFDEGYHRGRRQQLKDRQRDKFLVSQGYKVIRVNEREADEWLRISNFVNEPFHKASYLWKSIASAISKHPKTKRRYVSSEHAKYAIEDLVTAELMKPTKQYLTAIEKLLIARKIPVRRGKMRLNGKDQRVLLVE